MRTAIMLGKYYACYWGHKATSKTRPVLSLFRIVNSGKDRVAADSSLSFLEKTLGKKMFKEGTGSRAW